MGALIGSTKEEKNIGLSLVIAMKKKDIKNKDFAKKLGIKPPQLSYWRTTGRIQSSDLFVMIKKLGFSCSDFMDLGK